MEQVRGLERWGYSPDQTGTFIQCGEELSAGLLTAVRSSEGAAFCGSRVSLMYSQNRERTGGYFTI